jgi:hypothetical protein
MRGPCGHLHADRQPRFSSSRVEFYPREFRGKNKFWFCFVARMQMLGNYVLKKLIVENCRLPDTARQRLPAARTVGQRQVPRNSVSHDRARSDGDNDGPARLFVERRG